MSVPARIITVAVCLAAVSAAVAAWRVADDTSAQASTATDPIASREPRELETGLTRPPYSWQSAAEHALREPKRVRLPYAEQGTLLAHEVGARAFSFSVQAGQTIELNLDNARN
jgi:hypothetical protein